MALRYINARVKNRRDSYENLTENNPLLYDGELCFESDTLKFKLGNGVDKYNDLPYAGGNLPTGCVIPFSATSVPDGFLLCDGRAVSRTTYSDLYNLIRTTYGSGNGTSTFNVPNLIDRFVQGTGTSSSIGTFRSAGLPQLYGTCSMPTHTDRWYDKTTGVFSCDRWKVWQGVGDGCDFPEGGKRHWADIVLGYFNAQKYNSIYGNSNTVQPPALIMYYIIKT